MLIAVLPNCCGNIDKKIFCTHSVEMQFCFSNIFDLQLVESIYVESTDMETRGQIIHRSAYGLNRLTGVISLSFFSSCISSCSCSHSLSYCPRSVEAEFLGQTQKIIHPYIHIIEKTFCLDIQKFYSFPRHYGIRLGLEPMALLRNHYSPTLHF